MFLTLLVHEQVRKLFSFQTLAKNAVQEVTVVHHRSSGLHLISYRIQALLQQLFELVLFHVDELFEGHALLHVAFDPAPQRLYAVELWGVAGHEVGHDVQHDASCLHVLGIV